MIPLPIAISVAKTAGWVAVGALGYKLYSRRKMSLLKDKVKHLMLKTKINLQENTAKLNEKMEEVKDKVIEKLPNKK